MYVPIRFVRPLPDYRLLLAFSSGEWKVFDMKPYLDAEAFAELRDKFLFKTVCLGLETVEWFNGADLSHQTLYENSIQVQRDSDGEYPI